MTAVNRCAWCSDDPIYIAYHDNEWGIPNYDEQHLFEMLILEGMQAGLSWITILKRREGYRAAFDQFDAGKIATYEQNKIDELLQDKRIIRNRLKINAIILNAQAYLRVRHQFGSFSGYIWQFVGGQPKINHFETLSQIPEYTPESVAMSKDLQKHGFRFVGPTICYAYMQACGMVNDHTKDCFKAP